MMKKTLGALALTGALLVGTPAAVATDQTLPPLPAVADLPTDCQSAGKAFYAYLGEDTRLIFDLYVAEEQKDLTIARQRYTIRRLRERLHRLQHQH